MKPKDKSLLKLHIDRVHKSKLIQKHIVAISDNSTDDVLDEYCKKSTIEFARGNENDVLDRFYKIAVQFNPDVIVRLTADCPLIDPTLIDETIHFYLASKVDYASNNLKPTFPDGLDVEVFSFPALEKAWKEATLKSEREHVTSYIWKNSTLKGGSLFSSANYLSEVDFSNYRMTVDEKEDFLLIKKLIDQLGDDKPWIDYINYIIQNKLNINTQFTRNEGYFKSLSKD